MLDATYPIQILLMTLSGLVNRHQADVIAYLVEENPSYVKSGILRTSGDPLAE